MQIPEAEIQYSTYSLVDDFGKVFFWDGRVFRGIRDEQALQRYKDLVDCGLLPYLIEKQLFPQTTLTSYFTVSYYYVLEHERIDPLSFPFEWSFEMLKSAGTCILEVNRVADHFQYETVDAHPFNVLFRGCRPVFIDLGSLKTKRTERSHWTGEEELRSYLVYPLRLWKDVTMDMARRMLSDRNGLTGWEYNRIIQLALPKPVRQAISVFGRIRNKVYRKLVSPPLRKDLLGKLQKEVDGIKLARRDSQWGDYHSHYIEGDEIQVPHRFQVIIDKVKELEINAVTELAGNWGLLSFLLLERSGIKHAICLDYDEQAVNNLLVQAQKRALDQVISPVLIDFMRPLETFLSGRASVRFRSEAVIALAVTHHLILTQGFDIDHVLSTIGKYSSKFVFIEFMPMGLWDGKSAGPIPDWYTTDWFTGHFQAHFELMEHSQTAENRVLFIGKVKVSHHLKNGAALQSVTTLAT